jgi:hypothetical protein
MHSAIVLGVAALAGLSAGQATPQANYPYRIDPNSVLSTDRGPYLPYTPSDHQANYLSCLVRKPARPVPAHLPPAARRHEPDHPRQRMRPRHPDLQLRVRQRYRAQHHPVLADPALLHLPGMGHPVRHWLQRRQHMLRQVPVRYTHLQPPLINANHLDSADHPCGAQSPYRGNTSIPTTSSARPTGSGAATKIPVTGFGGAQATTGSSPSNTNAGASFVPNAALSMAGLCATAFLGFAVFL